MSTTQIFLFLQMQTVLNFPLLYSPHPQRSPAPSKKKNLFILPPLKDSLEWTKQKVKLKDAYYHRKLRKENAN